MTWSEIESLIYRVFPAAEIHVRDQLDDESLRVRGSLEVPPGEWIDELEGELEGDDEFEDYLEYRALGAEELVVRLNVVEGTDTRGESAFVPVGYASRCGPPPEWPGADEPTGLGDAYDDPPIDAVPPDDRTNVDWAEKMIGESFPHAEFLTWPDGEGLFLLVTVFYQGKSPKAERLYETATNPLDVLFDLAANEAAGAGSVWERESQRDERRRRAKQQLDQIPADLSLDEQLEVIGALVPQSMKEPWVSQAILDAQLLARLPARKPLLDVLREGESSTVEFKMTARSQYPTGERSKSAETDVARTVAAFMNSRTGGVLLAGVSDDGEVIGLDSDLVRVKGSADKLVLSVVQNLEAALGLNHVALCVTPSVEQVRGRVVVVIRVLPSNTPIYLQQGNDEEFLVRSGPSTKRLPLSQVRHYVDQRWGRGASEL